MERFATGVDGAERLFRSDSLSRTNGQQAQRATRDQGWQNGSPGDAGSV